MKTINTDIERLFRAHYQEMYHLARCILMDDDGELFVTKDLENDFTSDTYHVTVVE